MVSLPTTVQVMPSADFEAVKRLPARTSRTTQEALNQKVSLTDARNKSFMEQFWDEVEAAHNDGLYRLNPFSEQEARPFLCAA